MERKLLTAELTERYADLALRAVVTLAMAAATIVCVVKGYSWPAPSIMSAASTLLLTTGARTRDLRAL